MKQLDHRRRLIDSFVNAIYLFDDRLVITFNYKEGTKTMTFAEIEDVFGSDLSLLSAPKNRRYRQVSPVFLCESNGLSKLYAKESAKDDSFASSRRLGAEGHQVLLPAPNSRNPNLMPIGDGFGFLFVFDDLTV